MLHFMMIIATYNQPKVIDQLTSWSMNSSEESSVCGLYYRKASKNRLANLYRPRDKLMDKAHEMQGNHNITVCTLGEW